MRPDIVNLRQFYASPLGRKVKARLQQLALGHWPAPSGATILGIGYATPICRALERAGGARQPTLALMPAAQGAIYWPVHGANRSILADELRPPFAPNSIPYIVMAHALEHAAKPEELLRVVWQLMAPGGRLLLIVPNRRGLWARLGATPFATGTPYTLATLKALLDAAEFTLRDSSAALYAPPSAHPFWLRGWGLLEWLGRMCLPHGGGVLVIEAEKQIYAAIGTRVQRKAAVGLQGVPA